eukprot:c7292_g1_i2.p1 GENE.c7292_g1_i2~~c7292_g1_i2.p1  ORF type:complete len:160 (-),score=33.20 c7292_g1_i2:58-537(-)
MGFWFSRILGFIVAFVFPMYKTIKCVSSPEKDDKTQWLVYWVLIGLLNTLEATFIFILEFIPMYYEIKLALIIWLQFGNPETNSLSLYNHFFKPVLAKYDNNIDNLLADVFKHAKGITNSPLVQQGVSKVKQLVSQKLQPKRAAAAPTTPSGRNSKRLD